MKISLKKILAYFMPFVLLTSCGDDFLDRIPESSYVGDNFYVSDEALAATTAPLYGAAWFTYNNRAALGIGSGRANDWLNPWFLPEFLYFQITSLNNQLSGTWEAFYSVITMSNSVIEAVETRCGEEVSESARRKAIAEARMFRGVAYFYLVRLWNNCIIIDNNHEVINNPQQPLRSGWDALTFAINDFEFAAKNLPVSAEKGRATCWSAKALLAKAYLARSGWNANGGNREEDDLEMAKTVALDVCENSGLNLLKDYDGLFTIAGNNNEEALLQMQWVENGGWGFSNTLLADICFSSEVIGGVNCWGGGNGSLDMLKLYEAADSIRLNATFFIHGVHYPYINKAEGGYTYEKFGAPIKKGICGGPDDNDGAIIESMSYPLNTYIIRLADTYLTLAEACLGNNEYLSDGPGLFYFNKVRERAGVPLRNRINIDDIIKERRIEFCMEYCNWYDMTTWFRWKPEKMLTYFRNQHRSERSSYYERGADGLMKFYHYDGDKKVYDEWGNASSNVEINIHRDNIFFPYPESEVL